MAQSSSGRLRSIAMSSTSTAMLRSSRSRSTANSTTGSPNTTADARKRLNASACGVLRFRNDEICGDRESVLKRIRAALRLPFA